MDSSISDFICRKGAYLNMPLTIRSSWKKSHFFFLPDFNQIWKLHGKSSVSNFTEICSCDSRYDIGGQTDSGQGLQTGVTKERGTLRAYANAHN